MYSEPEEESQPEEETGTEVIPENHSVTTRDVQNRLAAELAAQLMETDAILEQFQLTRLQLAAILKNPQFRNMYNEAKTIWESSTNAKERTRLKAAMMVEDCLEPLFGIAHDTEVSPVARISSITKLAEIGDMMPKKDATMAAGDKFTINMNIINPKTNQSKQESIVLDMASPPDE